MDGVRARGWRLGVGGGKAQHCKDETYQRWHQLRAGFPGWPARLHLQRKPSRGRSRGSRWRRKECPAGSTLWHPVRFRKGKKHHMKHTSHRGSQASLLEKTQSVLTHQKGNSKITRILEATSLSLVLPNMTRLVLGCEDAGKGRSHLLLRLRFQWEQLWNSARDSLQVSVGGRPVGWSQGKTGSNSQGASLFINQEKDKLWRCKGKGPIFVSFENPDKSVGVFPRKKHDIYIKTNLSREY